MISQNLPVQRGYFGGPPLLGAVFCPMAASAKLRACFEKENDHEGDVQTLIWQRFRGFEGRLNLFGRFQKVKIFRNRVFGRFLSGQNGALRPFFLGIFRNLVFHLSQLHEFGGFGLFLLHICVVIFKMFFLKSCVQNVCKNSSTRIFLI